MKAKTELLPLPFLLPCLLLPCLHAPGEGLGSPLPSRLSVRGRDEGRSRVLGWEAERGEEEAGEGRARGRIC